MSNNHMKPPINALAKLKPCEAGGAWRGSRDAQAAAAAKIIIAIAAAGETSS
jgi:hypothetical protein